MPASQGSSAPPSRIVATSSRPLIPGRPTSITATSGRAPASSSTACSADVAETGAKRSAIRFSDRKTRVWASSPTRSTEGTARPTPSDISDLRRRCPRARVARRSSTRLRRGRHVLPLAAAHFDRSVRENRPRSGPRRSAARAGSPAAAARARRGRRRCGAGRRGWRCSRRRRPARRRSRAACPGAGSRRRAPVAARRAPARGPRRPPARPRRRRPSPRAAGRGRFRAIPGAPPPRPPRASASA